MDLLCPITNLRYLAAGSGEHAIVFIHGWSAFKEIWWSAISAVAPSMRAFAPDLPGHGGSAQHSAHNMADLAQLITTFCTARGAEQITLVGHSMGGNIAVEIALAHPQLIQRLVLVNPALQGTEMPRYTRSYLQRDHGWLAWRASMALARGVGAFGSFIPHQHGGGMVRPIVRRLGYMARHDPELLHRLLGALFQNPLLPRLPQISQPTLVVAGQLDPLVPAHLSKHVAAIIPRAQFVVMQRCAHNPMDEQPAVFETALLHFLASS
jgi:pimeloyl-ACP methyl ester carboxylesterase